MERKAKTALAIGRRGVCAGPRKKKYGSGLPRGRRLTAVLLATVGLLGPLATAPALAELQIHANEGLLTLAVWNWTPYYLGRNELKTSSEAFNPSPFWTSIWPYQQTGISFSSASSGTAQLIFDFEIQDDKSTPINNPVFTLEFNENTTWDIKAAADLLLHQAKSGAVSWSKKKAKSQFQDPAKDAAKEAATATAAEFGLEEVKVAVKVFKEIGKIFNALDPHRRVKLDIYTPSKNSESDFNDVCLNRSTDNATQRVVGPPGVSLDWSTADKFYVVTAGSVTGGQNGDSEPSGGNANKVQPGMIDMAVTPLCDFVCGAFNGIAADLIEYSQSDCTNAQSDTTAYSQYQDATNLLECLQKAPLTPANSPLQAEGLPATYLVPPPGTFDTYNPEFSCTTKTQRDYLFEYAYHGFGTPLSIQYPDDFAFCGQCVTAYPTGFTEAEGSWSKSCDLVSFDGSELCASCADATSTVRNVYSCTSCPANQYGNSNGQLFCE
jgi:hypothetical protein